MITLSERYYLRKVLFLLSLFSASIITTVIGLSVLFTLAYVTNWPIVFIGGSILSYTAAAYGFSQLFKKHLTLKKNFSIITGIPLFTIGILELLFYPKFMPSAHPPANLSYWHLKDGSKLAYIHIRSSIHSNYSPIVFLHGGPGTPDIVGDSEYFGQLSQYGYDVYVYDHIGTGYSSRLSNPSEYTIDRDVNDLEQVKQQINSSKIILIGHSYGGALATRYAALYPQSVDKLILSSPGPLPDGIDDDSGNTIQSKLTTNQKNRLNHSLFEPYSLLVYSLLQVNPVAAHNLSGDSIMDKRFENLYAATEPAMHCGETALRPLRNVGFYAHYAPQSLSHKSASDITSKLHELSVETLIIKGSCDYLSWSSAIAYKHMLNHAQIVYLVKAGHNTYQDLPHEYMLNLVAFLQNQTLQNKYQSDDQPANYK